MRKTARPYWITSALLLAAVLLSILLGSVAIPLGDLLQSFWAGISGTSSPDSRLGSYITILFSLRLPRTLLMLLVGAALGASGAAYQGLFRNPLADPYLIGVASGAGLGAVAAMSFGLTSALTGMFTIPLAAFSGAVLTIVLVVQLARVNKSVPITNLILAGVAASSFATALSSFLMLTSSGDLRRALVWLLGGSTLAGWQPVLAALPYIASGVGTLLFMGHPLNAIQFGDEQAAQLGIQVSRVRWIVIAAATLATAAAISFAGIIGFVGLIAPHILRLTCGNDYKKLVPLSMLGGAALLLFSDVLARVLLAPQEIPVGIITALAGAPFFFFILRRAKQQQYW